MSGQKAEVHWARYLDGNRRVVLEADHARIVAEAAAEARAAERRHWEARFRNAEQAHAAALAEATDRQRARDYVTLWARLMLEDRKYRAALARAALVIRQRLTDSDVFRLTGQHVRLHEWATVKPLPADKAAAPRALTADEWEAIAKQFRMAYQLGSCDPSNCPACDCNMDDEGRAQLAGMALQQAQAVIRIIHDGEATPQVKPCSTCGEPVAYLTARPGWAGGWLHHPSRPLDGHPAAIDGEATP